MIIKNKVALITGGARIGASVARALARRGCHLAVTYRTSHTSAQETVREARGLGVQAESFRADMTKKNDVKNVIHAIYRRWGRLDFIVNLVSIYESTPWKKLNEKAWDRNLAANLKSGYLVVVEAAAMLKKGGGRVIHFADWTAASGRPRYKDLVPYYAAKAGVIGLTQAQALELAPDVLVNAIAPGPILPPPKTSRKEVNDVMMATPLKRWGGADEIAKAVLFLLESDFVTGECIRVDGGRHLI